MKKRQVISIVLVMFSISATLWQWTKTPGVVLQQRRRIAFDETHGEIHRIAETYSAFRAFLVSLGLDVEAIMEGPLTLDKIRRFSVLILPLPTKPFSRNEVESLVGFVEGGGGLLILDDSGGGLLWGSNINNISKSFGIAFGEDIIRSSQEPVKIRLFEPHPATVGVSEICYHSGSSLSVYGNAVALAWGDENVWVDKYSQEPSPSELSEAREKRVVVMAASEYGLGRVLCLGSSTIFLEASLIPDHKKLSSNILKWLISTEPVRTYIQNNQIRVKFLDDEYHSSYQIDVWDVTTRGWTTAYHDVRFYTTSLDGLNVTWNMGGTLIEKGRSKGCDFLVVKYPEVEPYACLTTEVDIGWLDASNVEGKAWSDAYKTDNRTVRRVIAGRYDAYVLINLPSQSSPRNVLSILYADIGKGRVDVDVFMLGGWRTLKSFSREGDGEWRTVDINLPSASLPESPSPRVITIGIRVKDNDLIIDKISLSNVAQKGRIEIVAAIKEGSSQVYFYLRNLGDSQLSRVGIIGELATNVTEGRRFAFSTLIRDAHLEKGHEVMLTQGPAQTELKLGTGEDILPGPSHSRALYVYGKGWSEAFVIDKELSARAVLANMTNTFLVVPMPPTVGVLHELNISYYDIGFSPVDINVFNGSKWVGAGVVRRSNTGIWKTASISLSPSDLYLDTLAGGVKIGVFAYKDNFVVSRITVVTRILGDDKSAVALSCEEGDLVNFIVVPEAKDRVIQNEVDGHRGVVRTIDILTRGLLLSKGEVLPVAAVGCFVMDTSGLLTEVENIAAEGWRPKPTDFGPSQVSEHLAVARMNGSKLSFKVQAPTQGEYGIFIRYYDLPKGYSDKEVLVKINGRNVGRISYEGSGSYLFWSTDAEMVEGVNTIELIPLTRAFTSEIAYVDYVLVAPKFWEREALYELAHVVPALLGGGG